MTILEFLAGEAVRRGVQAARSIVRSAGGTGKIVIVLDFKDDAFRSGSIEAQASASRLDAKHFAPE
jgi:hypothetical protein